MPTVPADCQASLNGAPPGAECSSDRSAGDPVTVLSNAVRIERLSDDEDVDITDDLSNDAPLLGIKTEPCEQRPSEELDSKGESSQSPPSPSITSSHPAKQPCSEDPNAFSACHVWADCHSALGEEGSNQLCKSGSPGGGSQYESEDTDGAGLRQFLLHYSLLLKPFLDVFAPLYYLFPPFRWCNSSEQYVLHYTSVLDGAMGCFSAHLMANAVLCVR